MKTPLFPLLLAASVLFAQKPDWDALDNRVEQLYLKGDMAAAVNAAKLALDAASTPKQTGRSLDRLGFLYYNSGNLKDGEEFLRKSLALRREKLGAGTDDYAQSANDLALFLRDTRHLSEGQALAEEAVAVRTRVLEPNDPSLGETLETLGTIYSAEGQYEKSATTFEKARAIYESHIDAKNPAPPEYGTLLVNLAGNYHRLGRYQKAEADFAAALDVLRKTIGPTHPIYASSLLGPANLEMEIGNYAESEKYYSEAAPLLKSSLGETHPMYLQLLNNRAMLYQAMGNRTAAESDYRTSLELRKKLYGPNHLLVAPTLWNYGRLLYLRNAEEGENLMREAADIYSNASPRPAFEYANTLLGLGEAERKRGDLPDALKTFAMARDIAAQGLGVKHPVYASALADLGLVHQGMHESKEAGELLQQAIAIVSESQGESHPDLGRYIGDLAALYDQQGNYAAALPLYRQSFEINDRVLIGILNVGSEKTKAEALANLDDPLPALIAFQRRAGDKIPEARVLALEAVARRKGRVLDHVRDWRESLRENAAGQVRNRLIEWQSMLECESSLTTTLGYRDLRLAATGTCALQGTELEGRYGRLLSDLRTNSTDALEQRGLAALHDLSQRTDKLEADLSRDVPGFGESLRPASLADMRARLASDELLVEMTAFEEKGQKHYGSFLLGRTGDLRWLDLGPAQPIDQAVRDLIAAANDWSVSLARLENQAAASAEETAQEARRQLSERLAPLLRAILEGDGATRRLRISPDGMLTLVPFAALADSPGHYLIERYAISYLSAGRDLVTLQDPDQPAGPPVIALSPGRSPGNDAKPHPAPATVLAQTFRAEGLQHLDGAELEARELQKLIPRSQLLSGGQATEQNIKSLRSPAILHVVGHGLVRGNEDLLAGMDPGTRAMNLSAILLEEAYGRGAKSTQDGLLTALELESLDFHGSQMLVLSQCRMADGVPSSGDGVYGMRRAAAISGAKTFVAPLWNVSDSTERVLMVRFYRELSLGRGRADALRTAMLQVMRTPREKSFLFWAPVILSGDPSPLPERIFAR